MELLLEIIGELFIELVFEGAIEASLNPETPKALKILLIGMIILFFSAVIAVIFYTGTLIIRKYMIAGIIIMGIGILLLVSGIRKFRKTYLNKGI